MRRSAHNLGLAALCAALLALGAGAPPALGSPPLAGFPFFGTGPGETAPPGGFEGPCGLAVDSSGDFYVADYYHDDVDVFGSSRAYLAQLFEDKIPLHHGDPLDPCGLAKGVGSDTRAIYVDNYHRNVVKYVAPSPLKTFGAIGGAVFDSGHPTGVAVDPAGGDVYVDDRTYVAVYEPSGAPVEVGGEPLRIGLGSLEDGYGVAVSAVSPTAGRVYVPDAATGTVKVYDPATDVENPVAVIDGHETPAGRFVSLRDAAIAVDNSTSVDAGYVYVVDDLQPEYFEHPEAAIYGFAPSGAYAGRLEYNVVDALPPGLAVDGSASGSTRGRVYVTSGNTEGASIYAYGPGALGSVVLPAPVAAASAAPPIGLSAPAAATRAAAAAGDPGAHASEVAQKGNVRMKVAGKLFPSALPRTGQAPISVFFAGHVSTVDGGSPPQLKRLRIELNRYGRLDYRGLPACPANRIQPASTGRALSACRSSLVGSGTFWADIVLAGQEPYPTKGRLLVFVGRRHGRPALLGQIYAAHPFATSFVIPFSIRHIADGDYGTALTASLPKALGSWGYVTAIQMKLGRRYTYRGARRSFVSAGCPAPKGFPGAIFKLARTTFSFAGGITVDSTLTRSCKAR